MRTFMFYNDQDEDYRGKFDVTDSTELSADIIKKHIRLDEDFDVVYRGYVVDRVMVLIRHSPLDNFGQFIEYKIGKVCEITVT
jgi:hypothetical protein